MFKQGFQHEEAVIGVVADHAPAEEPMAQGDLERVFECGPGRAAQREAPANHRAPPREAGFDAVEGVRFHVYQPASWPVRSSRSAQYANSQAQSLAAFSSRRITGSAGVVLEADGYRPPACAFVTDGALVQDAAIDAHAQQPQSPWSCAATAKRRVEVRSAG